MVQAGQSAAWIAWGCLDMVATRVLMVWLYNNTGRSVLAVALYHAAANLSIKSCFPGGSYEAERLIAVILTLAAAVVTVVWGCRRLAARGPSEAPAKALHVAWRNGYLFRAMPPAVLTFNIDLEQRLVRVTGTGDAQSPD